MKRILIIEDDPRLRLGLNQFLTAQGYAVSICSDGREGKEAVEGGQFDLVITDLKLPYHDGFDILKRVNTVSPETGVIIMTGCAEINSDLCAKEGAFDYLPKPFSREELLVAVERFFRFRKLREEAAALRKALKSYHGLPNPGDSPA